MTQPENRTAAEGEPMPQGRHRAPHLPVPAPALPSWLPRAGLAAAVALALGLGVLVTNATGAPTRQGAQPTVTAAQAPAVSGPARLSLGAPKGAKLLPARPRHVAQPAAATPAAISGLAANGIPAVALNAYRLAAARLASAQPGCGLQWWLLAGIGRVESNHGRYGGASLDASGESRPHIIGLALDGVVYDYIADTDGGRLDADTRYDRAVGPMQFIPSTWAAYGIDGNGDGITSPFNINDAALAAGRYLCAAGGDLRTAAGRTRAVLAYNHSDEYLALVLGTAAAYAAGTAVDAPIQGVTAGGLPPVDTSWLPPVNPGAPIGAGSGPVTSSRGAGSTPGRSPVAGSPGAGPASSSSRSPSPGSSAPGSSGPGSSAPGSSAGSSGPIRPAPTSSAPAQPGGSSAPSSPPAPTRPQLPTLSPLPTLPAPTATAVCVKTVLGVVVTVPCSTP
ncbi:MAG TPA: lytic transglycosylase domain-containing protein [Jatrophihabitans sp.]|uniref:lytic transglycosylase domain-containing protein n=1 Tax=Jatrophihabitans sp. TaxID=1932789 RepID=UPI002EF721F2